MAATAAGGSADAAKMTASRTARRVSSIARSNTSHLPRRARTASNRTAGRILFSTPSITAKSRFLGSG